MTGSSRLGAAVAAAGLLVALAACETAVPKPDFPELTFGYLPPIALDVARVEVVEAYVPPGRKPNVEHLFRAPPGRIAARWARDRLKAAGTRNLARATVVNAAVVEVPLARTTGLRGVFTTDQAERYDGVIELRIEIIGADGRQAATVSARATRSRTVPEDITLQDREKVWFEMTEAMMNDLNASLERQIRKTFGRWLR